MNNSSLLLVKSWNSYKSGGGGVATHYPKKTNATANFKFGTGFFLVFFGFFGFFGSLKILKQTVLFRKRSRNDKMINSLCY